VIKCEDDLGRWGKRFHLGNNQIKEKGAHNRVTARGRDLGKICPSYSGGKQRGQEI